jgi:phosphonate transport system ATP-binding protein
MIDLDDISVSYGTGTRALTDVSVRIRRGELTVLLGPSGAGKSTLLRCLNLLTRPSAGRVTVEGLGTPTGGVRLRAHRRRTAMIFQQHQLIPQASVLRNVLIGRLGFHGTLRSLFPLPRGDRAMAMESLHRVGLLDKALERAAHLSVGQQQRVGIARALTQQPRLILADEPVASLDPTTARAVLSLLRCVCMEDGITAVVSLHQVDYAREFADRVIGLMGGTLIFDGDASSLTDGRLERLYGPGTPSAGRPRSAVLAAAASPRAAVPSVG